ncbi:hypothetical protein PR202_gb13766 [Eleusine coracana subsp. coracana]|uniref:Scarecrow-like protein 9 n=1 Tax=Eleusine coracana subsp. coracana TaxID=191504 RepID=A0AAV5ET97_ELECO|nr:hypothetical protein PR202_gb13766 [Eleusine coracana subsp. coracana]
MAAAPEEFHGQEGFLAEPFSPSIFLDLPSTPCPNGDGENLVPLDDLVLPFISRMLMEEDIEDRFFYQYPNHPALVQAQQTYAKILSETSTTSAISDSTTTSIEGSGGILSLPPNDAPTFTNAAWPYDPVELSQQLLFVPNPGMVLNGVDTAVHSSGFLDDSENETTLPACAGNDTVTTTFFRGQNMVNMEMFNLAFLRGMEEAKKFLPTNNGLLIDLEPTSREDRPRDSKLFQGVATSQLKEDEALDGLNSKVMVPEPEETGDMVDKMIIDGYDMCLDKMKSLHITMGSEAEKNTRKQGNGRLAQARQSSQGVVDLRALLIHCVQAISMDDRRNATEMLRQIKQHSSPQGDANQRLAHCLAEGLEARLAGTGSHVYKSLMTKRTSVVEFLKAYHLYLAACCFEMTAIRFSNMTICKAIAGRKKVHIVDYGVQYGLQWPSLLAFFATWESGPPEVRITGIDLPQPGFRPASRIEETGRRLSNFAHQFGVPFKFHSITAKWDAVCIGDLNIDPDEVLVVNSITQFGNLMDESVDIYSPSPWDVVLWNIRKMRPDVFILCVANGSYGVPFFVTRFREVLFHYSAIFDMLDATVPRNSEQRLLVERDIIGRCILNVVSCEGLDRAERPETYKQWQLRNCQAGLRQVPLYPDIVKILRAKVKNQYHKDFVIDVDHHWFLQGWKGRILYAMSTWVAHESVSDL